MLIRYSNYVLLIMSDLFIEIIFSKSSVFWWHIWPLTEIWVLLKQFFFRIETLV